MHRRLCFWFQSCNTIEPAAASFPPQPPLQPRWHLLPPAAHRASTEQQRVVALAASSTTSSATLASAEGETAGGGGSTSIDTFKKKTNTRNKKRIGTAGLEPATSGLIGKIMISNRTAERRLSSVQLIKVLRRSNQLSYVPSKLSIQSGLEPLRLCLTGIRSTN